MTKVGMKGALRRLLEPARLQTAGVTAAFLAGCALVAVGAGLVFLPAGLITGGVILIGGSLLFARGGDAS